MELFTRATCSLTMAGVLLLLGMKMGERDEIPALSPLAVDLCSTHTDGQENREDSIELTDDE